MGFLLKLLLGEAFISLDDRLEEKSKVRKETSLYGSINSEEENSDQIDDLDMILTIKELDDYKGKNYADVCNTFEKCGFTNIQAIGMKDLLLSKKKNGMVETVTINGTVIWGKDQLFPPDTPVVIKYHSPR